MMLCVQRPRLPSRSLRRSSSRLRLQQRDLEGPPPARAPSAPAPSVAITSDPDAQRRDAPADHCDMASDRRLAMPTGAPTMLECDEGRSSVSQARSSLAALAPPIDPAKFARRRRIGRIRMGSRLVAPDAPAGPLLQRSPRSCSSSSKRLRDRAPPDGPRCGQHPFEVGHRDPWTVDGSFKDASAKARTAGSPEVWAAVSTSPFESRHRDTEGAGSRWVIRARRRRRGCCLRARGAAVCGRCA